MENNTFNFTLGSNISNSLATKFRSSLASFGKTITDDDHGWENSFDPLLNAFSHHDSCQALICASVRRSQLAIPSSSGDSMITRNYPLSCCTTSKKYATHPSPISGPRRCLARSSYSIQYMHTSKKVDGNWLLSTRGERVFKGTCNTNVFTLRFRIIGTLKKLSCSWDAT